MNKIKATIIKDSISENGIRLTTIELQQWRPLLAEFNTHRMFSRNSASSRAIPVKTMLKNILKAPFEPVVWGKNVSGMQAKEELTGYNLILAKFLWKFACYSNVAFAYLLNKVGLHKQWANRIVEPWQVTNTIVTATEWDNFIQLRCHSDAQPEIELLANNIRDALKESKPELLLEGGWHLPYVTEDEYNNEKYSIDDLIKISVARCARVSYNNHDGTKTTLEQDIKLYDRLVGSFPQHMSPSEHQATPAKDKKFYKNFKGWKQHRSFIEHKK